MKSYPSISKNVRTDVPFYIFDKLDGSNIRAEWSRKRGFYKFGTRRRMLDEKDEPLGEAISLIRESWQEDLSEILHDNKFERAVCFFEFYGPNSFAGNHKDEPHKVTLFDVDIYKRGLLPPEDFLKLFGDLDIANLLSYEKVNQPLIDKIKCNELEGVTFEGVVCKAKNPKRKIRQPLMFKVKTQAWLDKLKGFCDGDENMFKRLS